MGMMAVLSDYISIGDAAHELRVSDTTVRKMLDQGVLEGVLDPRRQRWVLRTSLAKLVAQRITRGDKR
jgi:excisionase family DNA binding protein